MSLATEAEDDIDILTKDEVTKILDNYAVEKGYTDYAELRQTVAENRRYSTWESFVNSIKKHRIQSTPEKPKKVKPRRKFDLPSRLLRKMLASKNKDYGAIPINSHHIVDVEIPQAALNLLRHKTGWKYDQMRYYGFI